MADYTFTYHWQWRLHSPPEKIWPYISDTNRFNRDTGLPALSTGATVLRRTSDGTVLLAFKRLGIAVEWTEEPFNWEYLSSFGVIRNYSKGPVKRMLVNVQVKPDGTGSVVDYRVEAVPANLLGYIAIPVQIGIISSRSFRDIFLKYDVLAASNGEERATDVGSELTPAGERALQAALQAARAEGAAERALAAIANGIRRKDILSLMKMRPYEYARSAGIPRRQVLEAFLHATKAGVVTLQWDLLCPLCRGAGSSFESLSQVNPKVHCDSCNIDFTVDFERLVEITFRPHPTIRQVDAAAFCVGGPQVTPHIISQQNVGAGSSITIAAQLPAGRYRVRSAAFPNGTLISVEENHSSGTPLQAVCTAGGWEPAALQSGPGLALTVLNESPLRQLIVFERMAWSEDSVTATEVTALQVFRDLFSKEVIRQGEQISVGSITIVFTDLKNSTRMYREIGDASAFGFVMDHFTVLRTAVAGNNGTIVKTIGDAVMAVFTNPADAVAAMLEAGRALSGTKGGSSGLRLKSGIHSGHCISVNLNDRLDYFGSTVNICARLEGYSAGDDIILSDTVYNDYRVQHLLGSLGLAAAPFNAALKGFDGESFGLFRLPVTNGQEAG